MFNDKTLACSDCQNDFLFSAEEQEFFQSKKLTNEPRRCQSCRLIMRAKRRGVSMKSYSTVDCACCGVSTNVPFKPREDRPVYCSVCFRIKKVQQEIAI